MDMEVNLHFPKSLNFICAGATLALGVACTHTGGGSPQPTAPAFTTHPAGVTVAPDADATFTAAASGLPAPAFTWQRSDDRGTTWTGIAGATGPTYTFRARLVDNGAWFRAIASNRVGSNTSHTAELTVAGSPAPVFTTQPGSAQASPGGTATFTVAVTGLSAPTVAWQRSNDGGTTWNPIDQATSLTYTFTAALPDHGAQFRAVVTGPGGMITSQAATLTVTEAAPPAATTVIVAGQTNSPTEMETRSGFWQNGAWTRLESPDYATGSNLTALAVSGGTIYAAGTSYDRNTGAIRAGYWVGGTWRDVTPAPGTDPDDPGRAEVIGMVVAGTDVYMGGTLVDAEGRAVPGHWLNGAWNPAAAPLGDARVYGIARFGNDIYLWGHQHIGGQYLPGYWLNGAWQALPTAAGADGAVYALTVADGVVYAVGQVQSEDGPERAGLWQQGVWIPLEGLVADGRSAATGVAMTGGTLRIIGGAAGADGNRIPGIWTNRTWAALPLPAGTVGGTPYNLTLHGSDVYVSGHVHDGTMAAQPGYWLNGAWVALAPPAPMTGGDALAVVVQS